MKNFYEVLEISENASQEVIERVYKLFAKKYHPDLNPDNPKEAEEKFKEITEAYETLSDETKRKSYDIKLKSEKQKAERTTNQSSSSAYSSSGKQSASYENAGFSRGSSSTNNNNSSTNYSHFSTKENDTKIYEENLKAYSDMLLESQKRVQAEREFQIKKAYNDAYIEALKSMGIKVVYKKTLKEEFNSFMAVLLFLVILVITGFVAYQIPQVQEQVNDLLNMIPKNPTINI